MAVFITTSVTYTGKQTTDIFLRPMAIGANPIETDYFRVKLGIKSNELLNYIGSAAKRLKTYAVGFTGVVGPAYTQRTLSVYKLKAEAETDASVFFGTILEYLQGKDWNDLTDSELKSVIMKVFMDGVKDDIFRIAWLGNPYKTGVTSYLPNGTPDTDYNQLTGIWRLMYADASTTPSDTQIKRIDVNSVITGGYVAQIQTVTLSGSAGTANILVNGVNYLATYRASITDTDTDFIALHGAALLLRDIVVTGTTTLIFTSAIAGQNMAVITVTEIGGSGLTGSVAQTLANTAPSALAAGKSVDILQSMSINCSQELRAVDNANKVFLVSQTIYDNYYTYLLGVATNDGRTATINGVSYVAFKGIPVIPMKWDYHLDADFAHANGSLPARIHRALLVEKGNLVIGVDDAGDYQQADFWFNKDLEMNRFRCKLAFGVNYVHNRMICAAF